MLGLVGAAPLTSVISIPVGGISIAGARSPPGEQPAPMLTHRFTLLRRADHLTDAHQKHLDRLFDAHPRLRTAWEDHVGGQHRPLPRARNATPKSPRHDDDSMAPSNAPRHRGTVARRRCPPSLTRRLTHGVRPNAASSAAPPTTCGLVGLTRETHRPLPTENPVANRR